MLPIDYAGYMYPNDPRSQVRYLNFLFAQDFCEKVNLLNLHEEYTKYLLSKPDLKEIGEFRIYLDKCFTQQHPRRDDFRMIHKRKMEKWLFINGFSSRYSGKKRTLYVRCSEFMVWFIERQYPKIPFNIVFNTNFFL